MNILIVKLSSIGDVIHTLPSLVFLRRIMPEARISWAVEKKSAEILRGNPLVDNLIEMDTRALREEKNPERVLKALASQISLVRQEKFDAAIDFQGLIKSAAIAKLSKAKIRFGFSKKNLRETAARFLYNRKIRVSDDLNIVRKNLELASAAFGAKYDEADLEFPIFASGTEVEEAERIVTEIDGKFVILNPAGGWVTKLWYAERFGALADKIYENFGLKTVVATAPNEVDLAEKVLEAAKIAPIIRVQPSLKGFFELARRAALYVGGDTGPTHIAVAAGVPVVSIFGPTEWARNGSVRKDDIGIERNDIDCRENCHRRTCDKWICMDISVDEVFRAATQRLERNGFKK